MRKLFTIILAMVMLFAITAFIVGCGNGETVVETPTPTPTPTAEPEIVEPEFTFEYCSETGYPLYPNARYFIDNDGNIFTPIYFANINDIENTLFIISVNGSRIFVSSERLFMELPEPEVEDEPEVVLESYGFQFLVGTWDIPGALGIYLVVREDGSFGLWSEPAEWLGWNEERDGVWDHGLEFPFSRFDSNENNFYGYHNGSWSLLFTIIEFIDEDTLVVYDVRERSEITIYRR